MDGQRFDAMTQIVTMGSSRRRVLGGIIAGTAAIVAGAAVSDAKRGGKGKKQGNGNGNGNGKVQFCHKGNGSSNYTLINVSNSAAKAHLKHGDVQCEAGVCQTGLATGCGADGSCTFALATAGTACTLNGANGRCTAQGACDTSTA